MIPEIVHLLLGSNLNNKISNLEIAVDQIEDQLGNIISKSSIYRSPPWGVNEVQNEYFNQAIKLQTYLNATEILKRIQKIEKSMGRTRTKPNESRIIDIDILLWGAEMIQEKNLQIPHPRLHLRKFALLPLAEIDSGLIHPVLRTTIKELILICPDNSKVERIIK